MKIAILSDIHGNSLALDAVLDTLKAENIDGYWILGDLVALGPDPVGVLERILTLENCSIIRGNTDRYIYAGDRPPPYLDGLELNPESVQMFAEMNANFAWTQGALTATSWIPWLSQLPIDFRITLENGTKCLCVHASPGLDDGHGIDIETSDAELRKLLHGCEADLIFIGHTHQQIDRKIDRWHVVNPGSISNPRPPVLKACFAILETSPEGNKIIHRQVDYDREMVIDQLIAINHPGVNFISNHLRGLRK